MTKNARIRLIEARKRRGWSQQEVAARLGTTQHNVSRWELGLTTPTQYFRRQLSKLFGQSIEDLELLVSDLPPEKGGVRGSEGRGVTTDLPKQEDLQRLEQASSPVLDSRPPSFPQQTEALYTEAHSPDGKALYDPAIPMKGKQDLIGRTSLLEQLTQVLCTGKPFTIVALHGLPGVGKTALAIELAHDTTSRDTFCDGMLWAALGPSPHILDVLSRWGTILGMSSQEAGSLSEAGTWTIAIRSLVGSRRMLILLDDAWHSQDIQPLLVGGPHCAYLMTTRHSNVALGFAHTSAVLVEELDQEQGLRLLVDLAPAMLVEDRQTLLDLVQAVGGLPLALVLMGNYMRIHSYSRQPARIRRALTTLRRPEERLKLAQPSTPFDSTVTQPSPVVSLPMVIGVSTCALDEGCRQALHALACLPAKPNTFSEEAALVITGRQAETLDHLCDAGLLESRGAGRYTMHQTIVDYARTQGAHRQAHECIIAYFTALVKSKEVHEDRLEQEVENILAAFQLACQHENWPVLVRGITAFAPFLAARGMYPIVRPFLLRVRQALFQPDQESYCERANISFHLGRIADFQGAYQEADNHYAVGWEVVRSVGDEHLTVLLLAYWGEMLTNAGSYQRGEKILLEGLQLAQAGDYHQQTCLCFKNLGEIAASIGNIALAISYHQQGLVLARQLAHEELVSVFLQNLAAHHAWRGDFPQAETYYREALSHARQIDYRQRCSAALSGLGFTLLRQQRFSEAEQCLQESLALARTIQSPVRTSCVLQNLGIAKSKQGAYDAADEYLQESLQIATTIGHTWLISETLYYQGELLLKQKRFQEAQAVLERASKQAREQHEQELIALTCFGLARVLWAQDKACQAEACAKESLALFRTLEHEQADRVESWLQGKR